MDPRAGTPAQPSDLVDLDALAGAYYDREPDLDDPAQRVVFGTSGHRGSALDTAFNEAHIVAITAAIVEYRRGQGTDGPLFIGRDTHALSEPAWRSALEVLGGGRRRGARRRARLVHADARASRTRSCGTTAPAPPRASARSGPGLADGIVVTPSHNPPRDGGFKYNPPHGGPAGSDATGWIADRANEILASGWRQRPAGQRRGGARGRHHPASTTTCPSYVADLANVIDLDAIRDGRRADRRGPAGRRVRRVLGRDRRALRPRPHRGEPDGRPALGVHDARLGRQDPDGLLVAVRDGLAGRPHGGRPGPVRHRDRQRRRLRPARHRHARRADEPEPLPRGRHRLPVRRRAPGLAGRHRDRQDARLVEPDRPGRRPSSAGALLEVPVGFKWFVPGLVDGSVGFGGEESAGASFLRKDGTVWTTDKDGILPALLASEILATTGKSPSAHHRGARRGVRRVLVRPGRRRRDPRGEGDARRS